MIEVRIVTAGAELDSLRIQGKALAAASGSDLTFHQLEFPRLWWKHFNGLDGSEFGDKRGRNFLGTRSFQEDAPFVAAWVDGCLCGLAPLLVTRAERKGGKPPIRVLGFCADSVQVFYQDLLASPDRRDDIVAALAGALCSHAEANGMLLFLGYLPEDSPNLPALNRVVKARISEGWKGGIAVSQSRGGVYPWNIPLLCKAIGELGGIQDLDEEAKASLASLAERLEQQTSALLVFGATRSTFEKEVRALAELHSANPATRDAAGRLLEALAPTVIRYPYLPLPGTAEEYHESLSSSKRYWFRRYLKKYVEAGGTFEVVEPGELNDADIEDYLRLHAERWGKESIAVNPATLGFHRELVRAMSGEGVLRLFFARCGGKRLAVMACFDIAGRREYFFGGRTLEAEELRAGKLLVMHTVLDAIARGFRTFDFGYGGDEYKSDFTKSFRTSRSVFLCKDPNLFDPEGLFAKYEQMRFLEPIP